MNRPQAIAVVLAAAGLLGVLALWRSSSVPPALECPDGGPVQLGPDGVASCRAGAPLPAGQALTLHQKFDCNTATEADFALVPGVGPTLARELVAARDGGFERWEQVDAVSGVGAARLNALQAACDIRVVDAGVW
jgi:DNA uptake protein ComE-like DNA-binding protein